MVKLFLTPKKALNCHSVVPLVSVSIRIFISVLILYFPIDFYQINSFHKSYQINPLHKLYQVNPLHKLYQVNPLHKLYQINPLHKLWSHVLLIKSEEMNSAHKISFIADTSTSHLVSNSIDMPHIYLTIERFWHIF